MLQDISEQSFTETRDLRSGKPIWAASQTVAMTCTPLQRSQHADVVVVGAGITGAFVAEALAQRGLSVIVLDRRLPVHGSTMASTALLQFEIDEPLLHLVDAVGFERARRIWQRSYRAVGDLMQLVQARGLDCHLRPREAIYLAGNILDAKGIARECALRQRIGLPCSFMTHADLRAEIGVDRAAALRSGGSADVDPVQLATGLLAVAALCGARIHSPTELADVHASARKVEMVTRDGVELSAASLIFATGYELAKGVPLEGHRRTSTWAFATKPQPAAIWGKGELIWEASTPYLYIRGTADGRVIVGGEDEQIEDEAARDARTPGKIAALKAKTQALFPALDTEAEFAWAGTFGESDMGLPSIGAVPGMDNCYAVLGYGGNGITFGMIAAQLLRDTICGNPDADAELFAFRS